MMSEESSAKSQGSSSIRVLLATVVAVAIIVVIVVVRMSSTSNPEFPSLVATPDPALHGTVAYYDNPSRCVRAISVSGAASKEVMCMPELDVDKAKTEGKPVGWNLTWRSDNRLEITQFLMMDKSGSPTFKPGWQKVVDVVSGAVEEVPADQIALLPTPGARTTTSPAGDVVAFTSDSGHVMVTLNRASGEAHTLLNAQGDPETYGVNSVSWSPDFKWAAVDDGHLLITTLDNPGVTRTLTPPLQTDYGYDALHWFDITAIDLLK